MSNTHEDDNIGPELRANEPFKDKSETMFFFNSSAYFPGHSFPNASWEDNEGEKTEETWNKKPLRAEKKKRKQNTKQKVKTSFFFHPSEKLEIKKMIKQRWEMSRKTNPEPMIFTLKTN